MEKKKKCDDGHRIGKYNGYTLLTNGNIEVAPIYTDEMDALNIERTSVASIMKMMTAPYLEILKSIEKRERDWWKKVSEDYGLEGKKIVFSGGILSEIKDNKGA